MSVNYKITELDMNDLHPLNLNDTSGSKYMCIGKPGTGKSRVITQFAYTKKHIIPTAEIISGTELYNHHYEKYFPKLFIHYDYEEKTLEDFQSRQLAAKNNLNNPWSLLVVDDCTTDKKVFNTPLVNSYYKNGRHWKMVKFLAMQAPLDVTTTVRTCTDGTFIGKEQSEENREKLWKNYASIIPKRHFNIFMDELTEDFNFLFVKNNIASKSIEDCVFYFRADLDLIPDDWKFGSEAYWDINNIRYDNNYKPTYKTMPKKKK